MVYQFKIRILLFVIISCLFYQPVLADVVKPALVEIEVDTEKQIVVEVRASIEALLTGINAQYKNTQDAPNAEEYDVYRKMPAAELQQAFSVSSRSCYNLYSYRPSAKPIMNSSHYR